MLVLQTDINLVEGKITVIWCEYIHFLMAFRDSKGMDQKHGFQAILALPAPQAAYRQVIWSLHSAGACAWDFPSSHQLC